MHPHFLVLVHSIQVYQLSCLIQPIFDSERFCVHLSLPSSTEESSDLILHVKYSFVDSVSAYDPNVDDTTPDTDIGADTETDADTKTLHCDPDKDFYRLLHSSTTIRILTQVVN